MINAPASRRFFVSMPRIRPRVLGILVYGGMAFVIALGLALSQVAPNTAGPVCIALGLGIQGVVLWGLTTRPVALDVGPNGIAIDEGRRGRFPSPAVRLGEWNAAHYNVPQGTALHLESGGTRFRLGGRDHRPRPEVPLDAAPTETVDAFLPLAEFDALLLALNAAWAMSQPPGAGVIRCKLMPNAAAGPFAIGAAKRGLWLDLDGGQIHVVDMKTDGLLASADVRTVQAERVEHNYPGRMSFTMRAMILNVPGTEPIHVGTPDTRFSWSGPVRSVAWAPYVVGGPDWLALAERFGGGDLVIGNG
jgi:hypothetical protein